MKRPAIVIPASEEKGDLPHKLQVNRPYTDAIECAGGIALIVARPKTNDALDAIIDVADGLLLLGGHDVNPCHYDESDHSCVGVNDERDDLEFALLTRALKKEIPVLGICRGMQLMNVALGGSLYQDVRKDMPGGIVHDHHYHGKTVMPRDHHAHPVDVTAKTMLYKITKAKKLRVNSLHHQGVKVLGKDLIASAHAPDGLVEAIEIQKYPFGLGVEWHPEELGDKPSQRVFSALIAAARHRK